MYNPFSPFTKAVLKEQPSEGNRWFVVQRFKWPLVGDGKGFMVTVYQNEEVALWHASQLEENEGNWMVIRFQKLIKPNLGISFYKN